MLGSTLIGAGFKLDSIFYVLAALGLLGMMLTLLVPMARAQFAQRRARPIPQTSPAAPAPRWGQALRGNTVSTRTMKACNSVM